MCEQHSPNPAMHRRQRALKIVTVFFVVIHKGTHGSFIFMRVTNLTNNHKLVVSYNSSLHRFDKSRYHMIISVQTFEGFKLVLGVVACFQNLK